MALLPYRGFVGVGVGGARETGAGGRGGKKVCGGEG